MKHDPDSLRKEAKAMAAAEYERMRADRAERSRQERRDFWQRIWSAQ